MKTVKDMEIITVCGMNDERRSRCEPAWEGTYNRNHDINTRESNYSSVRDEAVAEFSKQLIFLVQQMSSQQNGWAANNLTQRQMPQMTNIQQNHATADDLSSATTTTSRDAAERPALTASADGTGSVTKTAVRRSRKLQNKLNECKVMYINIRGLKSKVESLKEILIDENLEIDGLTETMLDEADVIDIEGYTVHRNDRNGNGGGVLLAVKIDLKGLIVQECKDSEEVESLWMSVGNTKMNLRMGIVYNPQESRTKKNKLKKVYQSIEREVKKAKEKKQSVLLMGDFNCKVGDAINGNKGEVSNGGRMLLEMMNRNNLTMANGTKTCKGLWTRQCGMERSVFDYIILDDNQIKHVQGLVIDEEKKMAPYRRISENGVSRMIHSDHNTMMLKIDLLMEDIIEVNY